MLSLLKLITTTNIVDSHLDSITTKNLTEQKSLEDTKIDLVRPIFENDIRDTIKTDQSIIIYDFLKIKCR